MRLLVSGATSALRRHHDPDHLGVLVVPGAGNSISRTIATGLPWAADNAAFSGFDAGLFCTLLGRIAGRPGCVFVACPDKVGDAKATLQGLPFLSGTRREQHAERSHHFLDLADGIQHDLLGPV
jgi:hypothetical protein